MSDTKRSQVNQGIQANTVTADVLAVGSHATAHKTVGAAPQQEEVSRLVAQLSAGLAALNLQSHAKKAVEADVNSLHAATQAPQPQPERVAAIMENLTGKLKMIGVLVSEAAAVGEPLRKIAELFHIHFPG
jgi:hypothetical protein